MLSNSRQWKNMIKAFANTHTQLCSSEFANTFGIISVKLILSTRSVTNVYGNGIDGSKFGIRMCWCTTHTANISISSINRPNRTLPKNVTYLSCILTSVDNGISADVKESCIDLGGKSLIDFGSYCSKCSRLCFNTEYVVWMPSLLTIVRLTVLNEKTLQWKLNSTWKIESNTVIHCASCCFRFITHNARAHRPCRISEMSECPDWPRILFTINSQSDIYLHKSWAP